MSKLMEKSTSGDSYIVFSAFCYLFQKAIDIHKNELVKLSS